MCIMPETFTATMWSQSATFGLLRGSQAQGKARIVDQHVDLPPIRRQAAGERGNSSGIGYVQRQRQHGLAEFVTQCLQPVRAPCRRDDAMAVADEAARHRGAKPGRGAGHQNCQSHELFVPSSTRQSAG